MQRQRLVRGGSRRLSTMGFSRIQFTPDLLPADVIGTEIYRTPKRRISG
ncbi:MAG: AAA family ATPase [Myxococcota bacterium]